MQPTPQTSRMAQNLQTESGNLGKAALQIVTACSGTCGTRHLSISTGVIHISLFPGTKKIRRNLERKAVLRESKQSSL